MVAPPVAVAAEKPAARRRGVFGRVGDYFTQDRLALLGAALSDGGAGFGDELSRQQGSRMAAQEMLYRNQQREREDVQYKHGLNQQAQLEQFIARLPPGQREMAMLDPQGFIEQMMRGQNQEWEGGPGFTNAYRIGPDGQVQTGGALPIRPYAPRGSQFGAPGVPDGFQLDD